MYAQFYGFHKLPFQLTPDPAFFFDSTQHRKALAHLMFGLHNSEGFIVITGEVGAGKTTLVDCLLSQIDPKNYTAGKIVTSQLGGDDLLRMVADAFGLGDGGMPKSGVLAHIQQFLVSQIRTGRRPLLIIDEAQNLSSEALEELRMLSNITVGNVTAIQSFLLGQPQLREKLGSPTLDQLRQRIIAAYHLGPLTEIDTRAYVEHRLRCAGWRGDPEFTEDSFGEIYRQTGGVPRLINNLCSRVLIFGMLEESHGISGSTVGEVAFELATEISAVATVNNGADRRETTPQPANLHSMIERLDALDNITAVHDQAIRGMIKIFSKHEE